MIRIIFAFFLILILALKPIEGDECEQHGHVKCSQTCNQYDGLVESVVSGIFSIIAAILGVAFGEWLVRRRLENKSSTSAMASGPSHEAIPEDIENIIVQDGYKEWFVRRRLKNKLSMSAMEPGPSHKFGKKYETTPEEIEVIIARDGYKAWKFIPENSILENQSVLISDDGRSIEFCKKGSSKYDDVMIQTNYPFFIPDFQAVNLDIVHYFELTLLNNVSNNSTVAIGVTTKPYSCFRLPGCNKNSVGYHSNSRIKFLNNEFDDIDHGPYWGKSGDVIGCGYKPKTGEIFFTNNGKFLGNNFARLRHNWYPSIGSDGNVKMKINFGDEEFIYKDAQGFGVGAPGK